MTTAIAERHMVSPSFMLNAMTPNKIRGTNRDVKAMAAFDDASVMEKFQTFKSTGFAMRRAVARRST
jgi:hypothetical protein